MKANSVSKGKMEQGKAKLGRQSLAGKVQTVLGRISADNLGIVMTHEHLLVDLSHLAEEPQEASRRATFHAPLTMDLLGKIRYGGETNLDNNRLVDVQTAAEEVMLYKQAGGSTLVDATSIGIGRDPKGLAAIARATGLSIIMGCSYYIGRAHPRDMDAKSEDDIVQEILKEVFEGVDGTGIRAGIIGEVGCSWPLTANERKVLRASGRAQQLTGAPLIIHPGRHEEAPFEIVEILRAVDTNLRRTIMSHTDRTIYKQATLKKLAKTGCVIEYDLFGLENSYFHPAPHLDLPNDAQRLQWLAWLIAEGHGTQIVISHDVCAKYCLVRYGGCGYAHIVANIVPRMRRKGFKEEDIQAILVDTPKRVLAFV